MCSALLLKNTRQKIEAICWGLALCSFTLAAVWVAGFDASYPAILLDGTFFGRHRPLLPGYFLAEAAVMLAVVYLLPRRPRLGVGLALVASSFLLVETLFDLRTYANDTHLLLEEAVFALLYLAMIVLLAVFWHNQMGSVRTGDRVNRLANRSPNRASAPSESAPRH
ncbi:MAG: hypothetical protein WD851_23135 [Pirellulales bacterium]